MTVSCKKKLATRLGMQQMKAINYIFNPKDWQAFNFTL